MAHESQGVRKRRRHVSPVDVGRSGAVARGREEIHRRGSGADRRSVLQTRRGPQRPLELGAGSARTARQGKEQGEEAGAVELFPARRRNRRRSQEPRLCLHRGRARSSAAGVGVFELQRARHRQHGGARARRHAGTEREVAEAAAERRDPFVLRHDRAEPGVERRAEHRHARRARRRRMGHQRREVLHLGRRRSALQDHDLHGQDQPRGIATSSAVADSRADGHTRPEDPRPDDGVRPRRCAARPHAHQTRQRARAEGEHPARRGSRLRDLAGAARPGSHPPLHAFDRRRRSARST